MHDWYFSARTPSGANCSKLVRHHLVSAPKPTPSTSAPDRPRPAAIADAERAMRRNRPFGHPHIQATVGWNNGRSSQTLSHQGQALGEVAITYGAREVTA
jgi:hypothetical protein